MLREEAIDIRRQRAAQEQFRIQNLGRNRVFSDYQITNPASGGRYRVSIRGFDVGDNTCECPDFRTNTLGTCKHIEAVLASLREDTPPQLRRRKAAVTTPEIYLRYGEQLRLGLHLPPRPSPPMQTLADTFFDAQGLWKAGDRYQNLIEAVEKVPEPVTIFSDAMEFMEREIERREMAEREKELMAQLEIDELNAWQPDLIVLDEAQRIKNWESKTSKAVKRLRSHYAVVLTGTPLENKIEELYSIVQFVDDRRLGPAFQFLSDHRVIDEEGKLLGYR